MFIFVIDFNMIMGKIRLTGMKFYAYHGFFEEEQKIGGEYLVDLELEVDVDEAVRTDELLGTVDYGLVYEIVLEQMKISSKLIEHVAGRILSSLFSKEIKGLELATVKLSKLNPPLRADIHSVSIELTKRKQ